MVLVKFSRRISCTHNDVKLFCRKGHRKTVLPGITAIIIISIIHHKFGPDRPVSA